MFKSNLLKPTEQAGKISSDKRNSSSFTTSLEADWTHLCKWSTGRAANAFLSAETLLRQTKAGTVQECLLSTSTRLMTWRTIHVWRTNTSDFQLSTNTDYMSSNNSYPWLSTQRWWKPTWVWTNRDRERDQTAALRYFFPLNVLISRWSRQRKKQQLIREKTHTGDMKHPHIHFITKNTSVLRYNIKAHEVLEHGSQFISGPTEAGSELYNDLVV